MEFKTDKYQHGLIAKYEALFAPLKEKNLKILEVGVYRGGSLLWLADYFRNSEIIGVDLELPVIDHERIEMSVCDQNYSASLQRIGQHYGPFDIIIDDGSHEYSATKNTFENLYRNFLNSGGLYIIEDFIAGYWPEFPQYRNLHKLVFKIAESKNELEIKEFELYLQDPKCSIAYFAKK